ncbi:hypothetical protein [Leptospira bandrabouensis]|uniref:hypothetical protein n=2 Tax=Leptospira bandrabouensis TaxID=2484903 RepID=UPI001EE91132|nr:hypothetical protein [Leptospira bandrabouensis]MCG6159763.1 hypothetical protein [Leptospira bandrabouensis]
MSENIPSILYRRMLVNSDTFPVLGRHRDKLGVRISIDGNIPEGASYTVSDVNIVGGKMETIEKGMSSQVDITRLIEVGHIDTNRCLTSGTAMMKYFKIMTDCLVIYDLIAIKDSRQAGHYYICPVSDNDFEKYEQNIKDTREKWN